MSSAGRLIKGYERSARRLTQGSLDRPTTPRPPPHTVESVSNRRSTKMNERTQDRLFAGCGIAFVVLGLVGAIIAMAAGKTHSLTISSTPAQIAHAVGKPVSTTVWIGGYLEVLSVGAFLAFAVWACARLGGGLLGAIGRTAATAYAAVTIGSLAVMAAIAYRAGHGMGVQ